MTESVRAWHPAVPTVREVLHATFEQHAYPAHTHDAWTLLLIDEGAVAYDLDRSRHHAVPGALSLLPPRIPHDGRSAVAGTAFRKRVLYLDEDWLPGAAADAAAARPTTQDPRTLRALAGVHHALDFPHDAMAAEEGVLALRELVSEHLGAAPVETRDVPLARRLRALLDDRLDETFPLAEAAELLGAHPGHLVRVFSQTYGIAPHRYVTGRRVDRARRLLLAGWSVADAAVEVGFHDQAHLSRHFRRTLGTTPGAFAA
ncbi:AraC family transcriptional regulator [Herbiconiux sp. L3-i23]|nr:AraC family transcriptional regulator [Herbiconiux sp. L3-i23]